MDMAALKDGKFGAPYYFEEVTGLASQNKICVRIKLYAVTNPIAILNGIEIMKLNDSPGRLTNVSSFGPGQSKKVIIIVVLSITVIVIAFSALWGLIYAILRSRRKQAWRPHSKAKVFSKCLQGVNELSGGKLVSTSARCIPFAAVEEATDNFNETWVIGVGGFGKVYGGVLRDGTKVSVKRSNLESRQGLAEFHTEIELLSQFRHHRLVSLIGYCDERNEMILVYEFMENGSLKSHLYGSGLLNLGWKERLEICIGAARGLFCLHTGSIKPVIHRDAKSSNILLDENLVAGVADFGLSWTVPEATIDCKVRCLLIWGCFA